MKTSIHTVTINTHATFTGMASCVHIFKHPAVKISNIKITTFATSGDVINWACKYSTVENINIFTYWMLTKASITIANWYKCQTSGKAIKTPACHEWSYTWLKLQIHDNWHNKWVKIYKRCQVSTFLFFAWPQIMCCWYENQCKKWKEEIIKSSPLFIVLKFHACHLYASESHHLARFAAHFRDHSFGISDVYTFDQTLHLSLHSVVGMNSLFIRLIEILKFIALVYSSNECN